MNTRSIYYIDKKETVLDREVDTAIVRTLEQNLVAYCELINSNYAMMGIDVLQYPVKRKIYYLDNENDKQ